MAFPRTRPPFVADERTQLVGWLDLQRAIVRYKCEGLPDEDAHRRVLPASPLMTVAGVVSHLRWTEHCWLEVAFSGRGTPENPQFAEVEDADFLVHVGPWARLLDEYDRHRAAADGGASAASHVDTGRNPT